LLPFDPFFHLKTESAAEGKTNFAKVSSATLVGWLATLVGLVLRKGGLQQPLPQLFFSFLISLLL